MEAVEGFGGGVAAGLDDGGERDGSTGFGGNTLFEVDGELENRLSGGIIVAHKAFDAFEDGVVPIAEVPCDLGLLIDIEGIGGAFRLEMQFIAGAQQEIVGVGEGGEFGGAEQLEAHQLGQIAGTKAQARHPKDILVIAQAADTVLDIGLLEKDRIMKALAALLLIFEAFLQIGAFIIAGDKALIELGKVLIEALGAGDQARLHHGVFRLDFGLGLGERFFDGAGGVADLEVQIPERVEDAVIELGLEIGEGGGFGLLGVDEHDIDIAERAHFGATVAAEGEECGGLEVGLRVVEGSLSGGGEQVFEHDVDQDSAAIDDAQA